MKPEIVIYSADYKLKLIVETRTKPGASIEWATEFRGNFLRYQVIPRSPYFLLATPDFFFLWTDAETADETAPPDYCVPVPSSINSYLKRLKLSPGTVGKEVWGYLVKDWLSDVANFHRSPETIEPDELWLIETGLYQAIRNGSIATPAAA
jgi:hypothetical protein